MQEDKKHHRKSIQSMLLEKLGLMKYRKESAEKQEYAGNPERSGHTSIQKTAASPGYAYVQKEKKVSESGPGNGPEPREGAEPAGESAEPEYEKRTEFPEGEETAVEQKPSEKPEREKRTEFPEEEETVLERESSEKPEYENQPGCPEKMKCTHDAENTESDAADQKSSGTDSTEVQDDSAVQRDGGEAEHSKTERKEEEKSTKSDIVKQESAAPHETETEKGHEAGTEGVQKQPEQNGTFEMNKDALFCDGGSSYVIPAEPEKNQKVKLRFRTMKGNVDAVLLAADSGIYPMEAVCHRGVFDYYEIEWQLGTEPFSYYFVIHKGDEVCYYNRCGISDHVFPHYAFKIVPGFSTPDWAKGAVMYQIFVDRFYNGDPENDVKTGEYIYIGSPVEQVTDWNQPPQVMDVRRFYGGDLQGVLEKLDYLQKLGIEVIYFNPLFVSPSNHKYDIQDYDYIDPHYGKIVNDGGEPLPDWAGDNTDARMYRKRTGDQGNLEASNQLFIRLVEEIHRRGMRVILDGVFNHCGSFNKWMDRERLYEQQQEYEKGAYVSKDSPYHSFFYFYEEQDEAWPYNHSYDGWWGNDTLPKLNYEGSEKLVRYIMDIGKKWVSPPYNVDGWRLDVAADLGTSNKYNHIFWKQFREEIKSVRPDALILAEHYGDPTEWLQGDEWDSVMNYDAFMEPLTWFLTGMEKHSDEWRPDLLGNADNFVNTIRHFMACMLTPSLQVAMNELSNHDHSRFLTRTNHIVGRLDSRGHEAAEAGIQPAVMREAVAVQMTWIGAPTVYYGDEAGVCGFTDPDSRRTYPWGHEDQELLDFHREMIRIHKEETPLRTGSLKMLYWEDHILAYGRFQGREQVVVILNNSDDLREVTVPVWQAEVPMTGRMKRLIYSYEGGFTTQHDRYLVQNGEVVVNMGCHSVLVIKTIQVV